MKKVLSLLLVTVLLFTVTASELRAWAMVKTDIIYGDADGNEVVNTDDARLVLMAAAGLKSISDEESFKCADVNSDGKLTIFDARQILRACAGLVNLQPQGADEFDAIEGRFQGYRDGSMNINSPEAAVAVFNAMLNRVKTEFPGFTRSESVNVNNFNIHEVTLVGVNFGNSAESVAQMVKEMIISENEPEEVQSIIKSENCYNAMSVETENYVSKLSANDIYGAIVSFDGVNQMTISIALPDCEIDNISQTAYDDVFNTELIMEDSNSTIESVFASNTMEDAKRKLCRNAVVTLVFDTETGNVISYTTTYETDMYLLNSTFGVSSILSAELRGVEYGTHVTVTYDNFQW